MYYYNARYYDPTIGQFISPDTIVPDPTNLLDYNRYMMVRGNPINRVDPSGHRSITIGGNPYQWVQDINDGIIRGWAVGYGVGGAGAVGAGWKLAELFDSLNADEESGIPPSVGTERGPIVHADPLPTTIDSSTPGISTSGDGLPSGIAPFPGLEPGGMSSVVGGGYTLVPPQFGDNIVFSRRTSHGSDRHSQGDRPTGQAWNDAQVASRGNVFIDAHTGYLGVQGRRGRIHFFDVVDGMLQHHTSIRNSGSNTAQRFRTRRWIGVSEPEFEGWQQLLRDTLGE